MELSQFAVLLIGLVFNIMLIMFIIISVLLIYSLLTITIETKTFEFGVMRLVGLSKCGFITMIFIQGVFFVLPSIILAFISSFPALYFIYRKLFKDDLTAVALAPTLSAAIQALIIGLLIPVISAVVPTSRALGKSLQEALNVGRA